ncbi:MAG: hypothetical protein D6808_07100 [Candidatus Dadabacteria bacterium]|nr:MAG: hypothetical protein D6808_07100 [Candidatus Dadabacteria bacterium]
MKWHICTNHLKHFGEISGFREWAIKQGLICQNGIWVKRRAWVYKMGLLIRNLTSIISPYTLDNPSKGQNEINKANSASSGGGTNGTGIYYNNI